MKIAILYICTGKYNIFFEDFYKTCEQRFLTGIAEKDYFVFTDNKDLSNAPNVHIYTRKCQGFPLDALLRNEIFCSIEDKLSCYDYLFFFNSNSIFKENVGEEILPDLNDGGIVCQKWPRKKRYLNFPIFYPYERRKESTAYISPHLKIKYYYYMSGIYGGKSDCFIKLIKTLAENTKEDLRKGIIAKVHDESHLNKYLTEHKCKVLPDGYCMPEEGVKQGMQPKIVFREKTRIDPYFNKGRNRSMWGKIKKGMDLLYNAIIWYL